MAITTTTITKTIGWGRTDVIDQLEDAFTWLNLHGTQISGLVTSIAARSGGGTVGSASTIYYDVPVVTTSGIGTGASFDVTRSSGNVTTVLVNRPGKDYAESEFLTISADDIGETANGAVAIGVTVLVDGGATPVGYGSTNQFFDKNLTPSDTNRPWGVLKQDFDTTKKYGVTYRGFKIYDDYRMSIYAGNEFFPFDYTDTSDLGGQQRDSFRGTELLDLAEVISSQDLDTDSDMYAQVGSVYGDGMGSYATASSSTSHDLKLNIYRSSIDTDFSVLSFSQPSISGTINQETFLTFIVHNFDSSLWDYDQVYSAGLTVIKPTNSLNADAADTGIIGFRTWLSGNNYTPGGDYNIGVRAAEVGWSQIRDEDMKYGTVAQNYSIQSTQTSYTSGNGGGTGAVPGNQEATIFSRNTEFKSSGLIQSVGSDMYGNRDPITTYTSVIKGIPINGNLIPCPYYMPDDFVLIDFKLAASEQDIKQGDTITINSNEIYTVITGSYNKYNETAGILFCARTT